MLPDFRIRQRDYLLDIARALTTELNLEQLLGRILHISIEMLAGQSGMIALRDPGGGWHVQVTHGLSPRFVEVLGNLLTRIPSDEDPEKRELPEVNRIMHNLTQAAGHGMLNGVGLPLIARKQLVGVIYVFRTYSDVFSANDRALLSSFANQAAVAVQNAQFYQQIIREKQRLDALLDSAADGILILDPALRIERANLAFANLVGLKMDQVVGRPHDQVIKWHKRPSDTTLEEATLGGWPLTPHAQLYIEGDLSRSDGLPPVPVGITYAPLLSETNTLLNIIATVRDITRFRMADELKSTFVSIISHELKTPVALIKGYVGTLRRDDVKWDDQIVQESLAVIEDETDRLSQLIENLLDASRLQSGALPIKRAEVSLPDLARRMAERMQTQTTRHKIQTSFPENFPTVLGDEDRLEQVLTNLLSNAIKYSPGGEIWIRGEVRREYVIVCVSDQGPGIAPDDIPHVFDRFYRGPAIARRTKGAGLGLYLSRAIIEAHGGRMWLDSEQGKGARICFSIPIQE